MTTRTCSSTGLNRTFMELKQKYDVNVNTAALVLIEPLWNWNTKSSISFSHFCRLNRTFMELKQMQIGTGETSVISLNRTFMELKLRHTSRGTRMRKVLIEPLWNWNKEKTVNDNVESSLNRTFMELKHVYLAACDLRITCLNRTFMELKQDKDGNKLSEAD